MRIADYIPTASRKPKIDKKQALLIVPMHNPLVTWERENDEVVLTIPMRKDALAKLARLIIRNVPDTRRMSLDEVGSHVWELCDGSRNVGAIVQDVSSHYKLTRREAEASVTLFLQTLAKRNLIGLMTPVGKVKGSKVKG